MPARVLASAARVRRVEAEALAAEGGGAAPSAMWNDIILGALMLALGAWSALSARRRTV